MAETLHPFVIVATAPSKPFWRTASRFLPAPALSLPVAGLLRLFYLGSSPAAALLFLIFRRPRHMFLVRRFEPSRYLYRPCFLSFVSTSAAPLISPRVTLALHVIRVLQSIKRFLIMIALPDTFSIDPEVRVSRLP